MSGAIIFRSRKIKIFNMSVMCRICMIPDFHNGIRIYDKIESSEVKDISELIMSLCRVSISKDDGMSDLICDECLHELKNALTFKSKCEKTDEILRSLSITKSEKHFDDDDFDDMKFDVKNEIKEELIYSHSEVPEFYEKYAETEILPVNINVIKKHTKLKYECKECGMEFRKKIERSLHRKLHLYTCDGCKRQFKNKRTLVKHLSIRNQDCIDISTGENIRILGVGKYRIFCCTKCIYKSNRMLEVKKHIVTHTGLKPFRCDICHKAYSQFASLHYHKIKFHSKVMTIMCEICGKNISTKQQLYKHLKTHSDKMFHCKICDAQLKSESTLRLHMTRHSGVKNHNCEQCGSTFFTPAELCNHKKRHSDNLRLFPCPSCEYRAKTKSAIKSHVEKHSKEKPFSCNICGRMFTNTQRLVIHKTLIHNRERNVDKKIKCPTCLTIFNHMKSLRRHILNHHTIEDIGENKEITCGLEERKSTARLKGNTNESE